MISMSPIIQSSLNLYVLSFDVNAFHFDWKGPKGGTEHYGCLCTLVLSDNLKRQPRHFLFIILVHNIPLLSC